MNLKKNKKKFILFRKTFTASFIRKNQKLENEYCQSIFEKKKISKEIKKFHGTQVTWKKNKYKKWVCFLTF